MTKFYADLNPAWPSKGERRYAIFRREDNGETHKLWRQYNALRPANVAAYKLQVQYERSREAPYLGD